MMISNIFLFLPVIAAAWVGEWIYFSIAFGLSIFSPIYHYLSEFNRSNEKSFKIAKTMDWVFALSAYIYMYYYIFTKVNPSQQILFAILLSLTAIFFWYGYKVSDYKKYHPWFHIIGPIISALIVISKI